MDKIIQSYMNDFLKSHEIEEKRRTSNLKCLHLISNILRISGLYSNVFGVTWR